MARPQTINLLQSIPYNLGIVLVGFVVAFIGKLVDLLDLFIRPEGRQLDAQFGEAWQRYLSQVRR